MADIDDHEDREDGGRTVDNYNFQHLAALRKQLGLSQEAIPGLAKGTVRRIEQGKPVFLNSLKDYCAALGIDVSSLFTTRIEFDAEHPLRISVSRGLALRPALKPDTSRPDWSASPTVAIVSNLVFEVSSAARAPLVIDQVELASDTLGDLFREPMRWTQWVSLDNGNKRAVGNDNERLWLGYVSRFGRGSTITGLPMVPGSSDLHEVLFTRNSAQPWKSFIKDVHEGMLDDDALQGMGDGDDITMTLTASYRMGDTRSTASHTFSLRSSDCRDAVRKHWGVEPFKLPQYIQIELK